MKNEAVIGGITVAGQPTDEELRNLRARGFTTLVNVRAAGELDEPEETKATAAGLRYAEAGFTASTLSEEHVKRIRDAVESSAGPVAIHCAGGTRAAVVAAIISAEKTSASADEALRKIDEAGFDVEGTPYALFVRRYFQR
ncbi:MAG TPA: sulfur transferase domain-containing protein [Candidatus Acidoferrales bacterium]|nr:sulfur transferase domain-containing protein [Candidatus Acidoferrales bacterium]